MWIIHNLSLANLIGYYHIVSGLLVRTVPILVQEKYLLFVQVLLYLDGFRTETCKKVHIINYSLFGINIFSFSNYISTKTILYVVQFLFFIMGIMDGEAADHMVTRQQRTSLSLFLPHTWYCMIGLHVIIVLCMFICISEAHNGTKYVKTVINNSERFTFISSQILRMCLSV